MEKISLVLSLLVMLVVIALPGLVYANPIPVPTLALEEEYITIKLSSLGDRVLVDVVGVYPFKNIGYKKIVMFFPVPPNVMKDSVRVLVNGKPVSWSIVKEGEVNGRKIKYETALGVYPMLCWVIEPAPEKFTVRVEYRHEAFSEEKAGTKVFRCLYAMATGRFYYSKQCTAHVTVIFEKFDEREVSISLVPAPGVNEETSRFIVKVSGDKCSFKVIEQSAMFRGLRRDLMIEIPAVTVGESSSSGGEWIEANPGEVGADIEISVANFNASIKASLVLPHAGFKVEWGNLMIKGSELIIPVKVLEWTGPAAQVVTRSEKLYSLKLGPGKYKVAIVVNSVVVKEKEFEVKAGSTTEAGFENTKSAILGLTVVSLILLCAFVFYLAKHKH